MKKGFKLFLLICFMFTFVFSLAFAGPDPDPEDCPISCCVIPATPHCSAGAGVWVLTQDAICVCMAVTGGNPKCELLYPICQ